MESILFKIAKIIKEINLIKLISEIGPYKTCGIFMLYLKPYNSYIWLGEAPINFIYLNVLGLFKTGLDNSRFIIIFLCDVT